MRDTTGTGERSKTELIAAFVRHGVQIALPVCEGGRYDMMAEIEGRFFSVQCKTARIGHGVALFMTSSPQRGQTAWRSYKGEVDLIAAYCKDMDKCYLVEVEQAPGCAIQLRTELARNGQTSGIRMAADYELGTVVERLRSKVRAANEAEAVSRATPEKDPKAKVGTRKQTRV